MDEIADLLASYPAPIAAHAQRLRGLLRGAHLRLKKVRYLTYGPRDRIAPKLVIEFTRDAARIAALSRGERQLLALARSA